MESEVHSPFVKGIRGKQSSSFTLTLMKTTELILHQDRLRFHTRKLEIYIDKSVALNLPCNKNISKVALHTSKHGIVLQTI